MQATPLFLGACAFASIAGVVSGTAINTRPIQRAGIGMEEIARPAIAFDAADSGLSDQVALPDHYAMNTPTGRVGVAELSTRGLYSQHRYGWREADWTPPPEPVFVEPTADPQWSASNADVAVEAPSAVSEQRIDPATATTGQPRTIDVQSALNGEPVAS